MQTLHAHIIVGRKETGRWRRRIGAVVAITLALAMSDVPQAPQRAEAASPLAGTAPATAKCPTERTDITAAAVAAKLCGKPVEVADRRTETTQLFVNPDGTRTEERALAPVRVRRGDTWVPVDLTLQIGADGAVSPKAHPRALRFAGATTGTGEKEVVSLGDGDSRTAVAWTGPLPAPVLSGNKVTYPEVKPGVDLVFEAHATGYGQYLVAKDRAALARIASIRLPMRTGVLDATSDGAGGLLFKDRKGRAVGRAQTPAMWDAAVGSVSLEHLNRAPVGLKLTPAGTGRAVLELTPDAKFLARTDLTFPVTVDPPASLPVAFDTFVQTSYVSDQSGVNELKLGYVSDGGAWTARSYLKFNTSGLYDAQIMSAKLKLWNWHSFSCSPSQWEAWRTDPVDSSVRWTNQVINREKVGTSTETRGYSSSCGDNWVYIEIAKALQWAATNHASTTSVMLRATTETQGSWKRFDSAEGAHPPSISITYNSLPNAPTSVAVAPCYSSCGAGAATSALRPTLSAKLSDANAGQTLQAEFAIRDKATGTVVATSPLLSGNPAWTNGATATWQVSADLANGTEYEWQVRAKDVSGFGPPTAWTALTVDTTKPGVPFVSATIYLNDGQPHGGASAPDTFTFTPASGSGDLAAFVYRLDTDASATTKATTAPLSVTLSPRDGQRTLTVQAKDLAGNLSDPNTYVFTAGNAALAQPLPGANIVKRTKLQVTTPVVGYTRVYFEYRRGAGGVALPIPSANLTTASGTPLTATAASPAQLSSLGGYAIWNATDTLGLVGGVVEIRARIYTATSTTPVYDTAWVRATVDSSGDGGATEEIGPGAVNLLTGDYTQSATDADELGLSVTRVSSSRGPDSGYLTMPERLTANQRQVSTDLTGFNAASTSTAARSTVRGQGEVTPADSLEINPFTITSNDTFVAVGGDLGALRLNMTSGRTYRMTGWIFVPAASGLAPAHTTRGLRVVGFYKVGSAYVEVASPMAAYTEAWQELSVDMSVPAGATEAFFRLYNGNQGGSGKKVYWDNLSFTEVVAPFGPQWTAGATGGTADSDYTTLTFPQLSIARINTIGGGWVTFSRNADGVTFTPEPGSEGLVLSAPDAATYRLTELDGSVSEFKQQAGVWTVESSWTPSSNTKTRYVYDTANSRLLLKKVINPVEPGVDDANQCTSATPPRGCQVLEYVYATATAPGLSQSVFGDYIDRVSAARVWVWNATAVVSVDVARYAYDDLGRLREVWDPRVTPNPLKTRYDYDTAGRLTKTTPAGRLPWMYDYGNPDADAAALRWDLDGNATDTSGNGRNGTATGIGWGQGNDSANLRDQAATFTGAAGAQMTVAGTSLSNTSSYTVSAWVRLTDKSVNRTAVSKDGTRTSGFFLNYVQATDRWAFSRTTSDTDGSSAIRASSDVAPTLGQWTHLAGVYDTASSTMRLYVNGVPQAATAATGGWNATGGYVIGRAKWAGAATNLWHGGIDDVRIYGSALTTAQIVLLAGDENPGRLLRVRRAALQTGSKTVTDGETSTDLVYHVPLSVASGGPYDLTGAVPATWGQADLPTDATAVFGLRDDPARNSATPASPGSAGYPYAAVHYLNANGQEVNTATPGGHIDTDEYDRFGNVVRSLSATDRELALGTLPDAATSLAALGLAQSDTATRANALSTVNTYSNDGVDLIDALSPTVTLALENPLTDPDGAGPLTALPAGSVVIGRNHTVKQYDQGKPDGATYHLITTQTSSAQVLGYPAADTRVTTYGYDGHNGGTSGWTLRQFTTMTADSTGTPLSAKAVFNASGRTVTAWGFDATGTDARTREHIYYTASTNSADAACGNRPEWAGLICVVRTVGSITGHDPARMASQLPSRRVTRYSPFNDAEEIVETADGHTRTTATTFDAAGRIVTVAVTSDDGTALPTVSTGYDPATGVAVQTSTTAATIAREQDQLGRQVAYTDADGGLTTTEYDRYNHTTRVATPAGWNTFTYDRTVDPRDLLTEMTDSAAGTFTAGYSPDGQLITMTYPGGLTRTDRLDANQQPIARTYTRDSDGTVVYSESIVENNAGQWINHEYTGGSKTYSYDRTGHLTRVRHDSDVTAGCVTRAYTYDTRTNRKTRSVYAPATDGTCQETTADTVDNHDYDSVDRLIDAGYTYDKFGRTTALPGGPAITYYVNDLVHSQTLGDARQTFTIDPAQRLRTSTAETYAGGAWTGATNTVMHYGDGNDEPLWIDENGAGNVTRNVPGPDGDLAATTSTGSGTRLQLTNLHGDVAVTLDPALTEPESYDYDEFGVPSLGQTQNRYGWLGGKQRSSQALGGAILMGVRLYLPTLGRFLQPDPIDGGNASTYDYCSADPVNCFDLDGRWGFLKKAWTFVKENPALVASTVAMFTPPPINVIAGAAAVGFSAYSAYKNVKDGKYGAAALDVVGAIPGIGAVGRGAKAILAARAAKGIGKTIPRFKGFPGARKLKRGVLNTFNRHRSSYKSNLTKSAWWGRWDTRAAYPVSAAQTGCKYTSWCKNSTFSRLFRLF